MCGISVVYSKNKDAARKVMKILKEQEHRGKAATGLAWINDNEIHVMKDNCSPSKFDEEHKEDIEKIKAFLVLGHNRMPSQGKNIMENAHPFLSCDKSFAFIHNGHEDTSKIDFVLKFTGHKIDGTTDSEVMTHLLEEIIKQARKRTNDNELIMRKSFELLNFMCDGWFASAFLILTKEGDIWGSGPRDKIAILKGDNYIYIGSEVQSLKPFIDLKQRDIMFLEDNSIFRITKNGKIDFFGPVEHKKIKLKKPNVKMQQAKQSAKKAATNFKLSMVKAGHFVNEILLPEQKQDNLEEIEDETQWWGYTYARPKYDKEFWEGRNDTGSPALQGDKSVEGKHSRKGKQIPVAVQRAK